MPQLRRTSALCLMALWSVTALAAPAGDLAVKGVTLYAAPGAPPLHRATIIIRDGRVARIGANLPTGDLPVIDAAGKFAAAGLWNCHVHFTAPELAEDPAGVLRDMLLRHGFTHVVDTGSDLAATLRLAADIEAGRLAGPGILTANGSFVYTGGTPAYLPGIRLPEIARPEQAAGAVNAVLDAGADHIKIFSGSFKSPTETVLLPAPVIRAITDAAHARGRLVFSHPQSRAGLVNAVENGVDVLAHTAPSAGPLGDELVDDMLAAHVALIPTLTLWSWELSRHGVAPERVTAYQSAGVAQLREYARAGGEILFGTDVGYMTDVDTVEELELMHRAGLTFDAILAAMTTDPARRFGSGTGAVEPGAPGDLVLLDDDPAGNPAALARPAYTIRAGRVVYAALD